MSIGYGKGKNKSFVHKDLNLELFSGEMVCLLGQNGCGKSTLMRTLAGIQKAHEGDVLIAGKSISDYSQKELALKIALVLTDRVEVENATVWDIVSLGQHPYTRWIGGMTDEGKSKIREAISLVNLEHYTSRLFSRLSDGEKQRVMIAKALAQDTPMIFLDEPTAHLDLPNRVEIMLLLHQLAHRTGKAIIISTHELDLALQAADRIWLMKTNDGIVSGVPEDLVINGTFNEVFKSDAYYFNATNGNFSMNYKLSKKISVTSYEKTKLYWTFRALARAGYGVEEDADKLIEIKENGWVYDEVLYESIEELLRELNENHN